MKSKFAPTNSIVLECTDTDLTRLDAKLLIGSAQPRSPEVLASRLARQFIEQNKGVLASFDIEAFQDYDGTNVSLMLRSGLKVGALPLISPTSSRPDYGLVIKPRFDWTGIGSMLSQMGWRVVPTLLKLPLLPGTERRVPPWVLSSVILVRIRQLLDQMDRRFELVHNLLPAPKGTVDWTAYATEQMPIAHFLDIPCQYPDLRDDSRLLGVIHYTLRRQMASLLTQRNLAGVVIALIDLCSSLLHRVAHIPPHRPTPSMLHSWFTGRFHLDTFREGIQAIEWTVDDRGLAGIAELQGLPWVLPMDEFFEAWIETLAHRLSRWIGGTLKVGRLRETLAPIQWDNSFASTQKYLLPDIMLELDDATVIIDAKYKRHWEELRTSNWSAIQKEIQEQHRNDLMQILAYSTLASANRVIACLVYPCQTATYESMCQRNQHAFHATLPVAGRQVEIILTAVPMNDHVDEVVAHLAQSIRRAKER